MILTGIIVVISAILLFHAIFNLLTMSFSWNDPHTLHLRKSPKEYLQPSLSFSLLVPVRNEASVIGDTIRAMSTLNYPEKLYEVLIICRSDDTATFHKINNTLEVLNATNMKLILVDTNVNNKPQALNLGLMKAKNEVVAVFDAEDEPHPDILDIINTTIIQSNSDVVQSGVQLMDYNSKWFSALNVLEYYFWFKSALHFFTKMGVVPLGGNTVFIKKKILNFVDGWDSKMLTEDADLGIRLSLAGSKISVIYDEAHVTQEETPSSSSQFIKQRTRWNQGFLQILFQFKWLQLSGIIRKLFTAYLLFMPAIQTLWVIYLPVTIIANFFLSLPVGWAIFSVLPAYVLMMQILLYNYGMYEFTRDYNFKYSPMLIFRILLTFFPYQILLSLASVRAVFRLIRNEASWEKTTHLNIHRSLNNAS